MNIAQLRTLTTIADQVSFSSAAEILHLTPAAVSQQIKALEAELGVPLFDRTTRPPRLSAHGQMVADRARELLVDFDQLRDLAAAPGELAGRLLIGCVSGLSGDLLPRALARLRQRHPGITVRMEEGLSEALIGRVLRRELDAAVITEPTLPDPRLHALPIIDEALMVVAPPAAGATGVDSSGIGESGGGGPSWETTLGEQPFLRMNRQSGMGQIIDATLRRAGIQVEEAMELDSSEAIVGLARVGLGAGVVPAGRIDAAAAKTLTTMPFGSPPAHRRVIFIERNTQARSDLSGVLYEELRQLTDRA